MDDLNAKEPEATPSLRHMGPPVRWKPGFTVTPVVTTGDVSHDLQKFPKEIPEKFEASL